VADTPKLKIFENVSEFCDGTFKYLSWPNLVEIGHCEVAARSSGLPQPPFAKNLLIAPKIL